MNYFDYLKHNHRYHPHGFGEHTRCKYKGHGTGEPPRGEEQGACYEYPSFASPEDARKWLLENTGIEAFHITNPRQIVSEFGFTPGLNVTAGGTMDEQPRKPRSAEKLHFLYKVGVSFLPPPPDGVISWFDREKQEYVVFETCEDKMRHAMKKILIPDDLQKRILDASPNREWSDFDIWRVLNSYYDGLSYDEIVMKFKRTQP